MGGTGLVHSTCTPLLAHDWTMEGVKNPRNATAFDPAADYDEDEHKRLGTRDNSVVVLHHGRTQKEVHVST